MCSANTNWRYEGAATPLFTDNETNAARLYGNVNGTAFAKDAFHERIIHGRTDAVNPANIGTKFAPHYVLEIGAGESQIVKLRLSEAGVAPNDRFADFDQIFAATNQGG